MSCPTCTDNKLCTVDRRCSNKMDMDTCDWNNFEAEVPDHKPPYYEATESGRPAHPMLTGYVPELNDRYVEGFSYQKNHLLVALLVLAVLAVLYYFYMKNSNTMRL